jgi:sec-independent protein translocase protein TatB
LLSSSPAHLLVLVVVGILVLGPEKLPRLARDVARMIRTVRRLATAASARVCDKRAPVLADIGSEADRGSATGTRD